MQTSYNQNSEYNHLLWWLILIAFMIGLYYVVRFNGQSIDSDSSAMTASINLVFDQESYIPRGRIYPHGFLYQISSSFLINMSGVNVQLLQSFIWPIVAPIVLVFSALFFYRQLSASWITPILAVMLLVFQGDVLFVILRGSHGKIDWPLMVIALALFVQSFRMKFPQVIINIVLFYLIFFAISTTNIFFASTLLGAIIILSLFLLFINIWGRSRTRRNYHNLEINRLILVILACIAILFLCISYVYPPALENIRTMGLIQDRVGRMIFGFGERTNPYGYISIGWISREIYLGITAFTWILILSSMIIWLWRGIGYLREPPLFWLRNEFDWLIYSGFAIMVGISIVFDLAGVLSSNMQLRVFPGFTIMAVFLLSRAIIENLRSPRVVQYQNIIIIFTSIFFAYFLIVSLFKATNEPLVSNKWGFYNQQESYAVRWTDNHLAHSKILTGIDERFASLARIYQGDSGNQFYGSNKQSPDRHILVSYSEIIRRSRMAINLPLVNDWNQVYHNGSTTLYHRRPVTPYQR